MSFFISELMEGYKKNYCLICRRGNCKHIQRWKIETGQLRIPLFQKPKSIFIIVEIQLKEDFIHQIGLMMQEKKGK